MSRRFLTGLVTGLVVPVLAIGGQFLAAPTAATAVMAEPLRSAVPAHPVLAGADGLESAPVVASYSLTRGPNTSSRVVLSFDDCPRSYSAFKTMVLAAERANVALVLFPTGNCLQAGRVSARYARAHGHYVFNHSVSHPQLTRLSYSRILAQLGSPGVVTNYGRPPYGAYNSTVKRAYAAKGMRIWLWNVSPDDWTGKSRSQVVSYVVRHAGRGDTVLLHMGWNAFNPTALAQIKSGLAKRGIGLCRNYPGTTPVKPVFRC